MSFQRWSALDKQALAELKPNFGLRDWDDLTSTELEIIWINLKHHFFEKEPKHESSRNGNSFKYYPFAGVYDDQIFRQQLVVSTIKELNNRFKARSYAKKFLRNESDTNANEDFLRIFFDEKKDVVFELLSIYSEFRVTFVFENALPKSSNESDEGYNKRLEKLKWNSFDQFSKDLNEVFSDFGLNFILSRIGFIPRQEDKIIEDVFLPVLNILSNEKWVKVNEHLRDVFTDYRINTPQGYSSCVTKMISAVQAFLQILVYDGIGKGDIKDLILDAQNRKLIPSDSFTKRIFKEIESVLMQERQATSDAHPKVEYATEKNSRLVINLAMIFFQHCIQH